MKRRASGATVSSRVARALALASLVLLVTTPAQAGDEPVETSIVVVNAGAAAAPSIYIPTAAHLGGAAGSFWITDLEVHNYGDVAVPYEIALLKRDNANNTPLVQAFSVPAGESVRHSDVLLSVFGFTGAAALRVTPVEEQTAPGDARTPLAAAGVGGRPLLVTSRTFNFPGFDDSGTVEDLLPPDALAATGGTYGQFVPGQWESGAITEIEEGRIIQLSHTAGTTATGFRTNIGAVNTSAEALTVEIELFLANKTSLGKVDLALRAFEYKQIDKIFERVTSQTVNDGFAILRVKEGTGSFFAYASVIDNITGDPIYVAATCLPRPAGAPAFSSLTFGTEVDASWNITNPGTSFPAGSDEVYVSYSYSGLTAGDTYTITWYVNGSQWSSYPNTAHGSSGRVTSRISISTQLPTGPWVVEIVYKGSIMTSGQFTIGP